MDQETYSEQIRMCASCPKMCRHVCPTFFAWRSDAPTPHGRAMLLHYENMATRQLDERAIEVLYQCLQCSHCLTWCVPEIDIADIVEMARQRLVSDNRHPRGLEKIKQSITQNHNPFYEPHERRNTWFTHAESEGKKVIYFSGCTAAYREQSIGSSTIELLRQLGYQPQVSDDEWCCGSPLFRTGFQAEGLLQAQHNVEVLNAMDAELVVVTCPGCYKALSQDYPKHGFQIDKPVLHISQLLDGEIHACAGIRTGKRITFHDPCHLGRHSGIYDPPRDVIMKASGAKVTEMERSRENATCCGNGAGLRTLFPDQAKIIGSSRIQDAKNIEAELLITSCPFCKNMLASQAGESLEVLDLPEFILQMLKGPYTKDD